MKKIWLDSYRKGVKFNVDLNEYKSLVDFFEDGFKKYSNKIAYENMGKKISYSEIDNLSKAFSNYLLYDLKLKKGDRLAIQTPNLLQYPVVLIGALRSGIIVVNTNPLYTPDEMLHQFKDSKCKAIFILSNFASKLEEILDQTYIEHIIISDLGDMIGGIKGKFVNFAVKYIKKMVPKYNLPKSVNFSSAIKSGMKFDIFPLEST